MKYAFFPNKKNPKLLIPLINNKIISSSLYLHNTTNTSSRIIKKLFSLLVNLGIGQFFLKSNENMNEKVSIVNSTFFKRKESHYWAIYLGSEGKGNKIVLQGMDIAGNILSYVKVARSKHTMNYVLKEKQFLELLSVYDFRTGYVPELSNFKMYDDKILLEIKPPNAKQLYSPKKLSECHLNWLIELFQMTSLEKLFCKSHFYYKTKQNINFLNNKVINISEKSDFRQNIITISCFTNSILDKYQDHKFRFGYVHRDFVPWNMKIIKNILYVFDWEYAEKEYIPLYDLFHFLVQTHIFIKNEKSELIINDVFFKNKNNIKGIIKYLEKFNLSTDDSFYMFYLYCFDWMIYEIQNQENLHVEALHRYHLLNFILNNKSNLQAKWLRN